MVNSVCARYLFQEFRGHSSYVNAIAMMPDGSKLLSASSDGTVKLWDLLTTENLRTFRSPQASNNAMSESAIHTVLPLPRSVDQIVVCARSSVVHIVTIQGQVIFLLECYILLGSFEL